ncbi:MAG: DNA mismatch repair protein MutS [Phycisphaerae bacterium]
MPPTASPASPPDAERLTPAMRQWHEQKRQSPDALLLFRMGDFYELFYDDALAGARLLGITLTSRDGGRTPLAGIPHHALESYLAKLVAAGVKVAISEQLEDPRDAKGVVKRGIARIVTPGTLTDDALLTRTQSNILAAVVRQPPLAGVAALELSTGQFTVQLCPEIRLLDELGRLGPAEVLLPEASHVERDGFENDVRQRLGCAVSHRPDADFQRHRAAKLLEEQFETRGLGGFGFDRIDAALQAAGGLVAYVRETQQGAAQHLQPPRRTADDETLALDPTTLRSLEVERTLRSNQRAGSLLEAVDRTGNPMGARLLRHWLCYPLRRPRDIRRRQRLVEAFLHADPERRQTRDVLRDVGDISRSVGRIGVRRTTPRELRTLGEGLARLSPLRAALRALRCDEADELAERLTGLDELAQRLCAALAPDAPLALKEGGIFAPEHDPEVDRLRSIGRDGQRWLAEYQAREAERTGIGSLKVAYNRVFGYYIEITHVHRDRVPADYVRKQTVKNAERYITDELKRFEGETLTAESRANELEHELFVALREDVSAYIDPLQRAAAALAEIDVLAGWAELAQRQRYCRPEFVDQPILEIADGRHPALEQNADVAFVPNDTTLHARSDGRTNRRGDTQGHDEATVERADEGTGHADAERGLDTAARASGPALEISAATSAPDTPSSTSSLRASVPSSLALITGPNMAGKSTYIRQVALLTLLAHAGCWVPATRMRLGPVDRIFTRVGASDELSRGQSTFMVEMTEAANILHNATADSLVILDEVGRGTSTYDGLALAWAISEHLATAVGCRALFATHYHELTELASLLDGVCNLNVAVRETDEQVVFLHRIVPGAADRSYGLHVAKLAGVPRSVLERANAVLTELEKTFSRESQRPVLAAVQRRRLRQLRLFEEPEEVVTRELRGTADADLSADRALELVRKWRQLLGGA